MAGKRKCLSLTDKIQILAEVDKGTKKKDIAARYGIPHNSLSTIIKDRESIVKKSDNLKANDTRKRFKQCVYEEIDQAVLEWIDLVRSRNLPLSGPLIKEKAIEFAKKLNMNDFQGSNGWLDKFTSRHNVIYRTLSGESADVNTVDCTVWQTVTLPKLIQTYNPDNVFNLDETGLFFKCLPNKTWTFKNDDCFGGKHSKERVTVLLCCNWSGTEKLKPLVIGKSKRPRCFKGVKSLETDYDSNKKAWMTGDIFEKWLLNLDNQMRKEKRKILLFLDNCTAHPQRVAERLKFVNLIYFPPNMTSKLQPLDQGIIQNVKVYYRKRILRRVIKAIEDNVATENIPIDLRTSIAELSKVWTNDVTQETIRKCFEKAGFPKKVSENVDLPVVPCTDDIEEMWKVLQGLPQVHTEGDLQDFLSVDEGLSTHERISEDGIIEGILRARGGVKKTSLIMRTTRKKKEKEKKKRRRYRLYIYWNLSNIFDMPCSLRQKYRCICSTV